ncbi:MAG TPA: hypothetical protein VG498_00060 [Terriglobales bacterium]|nr:hypothetical protein [Terriglobales bacterium]
MKAVDSPDWLGKLAEQESDDVWLRAGVRIIVLLVGVALCACAVVFIENALTSDVSLITRMAGFSFLVLALVATPLALMCIAIGLVRRYILKTPAH